MPEQHKQPEPDQGRAAVVWGFLWSLVAPTIVALTESDQP